MNHTPEFANRLRDRFLDQAGRIPPSPGCPHPEMFWSAAARELSHVDVNRLLDHASGCPDCLQDWRLAREVITGAGLAMAPQAAAVQNTASPRGRWALWGSLAAAGAAVALLVFIVPRTTLTPAPPAFRSDDSLRITPLVAPGAPLARDQAVLTWTAGPEGSLYTVEVVTESLELVASQRDLPEARFQIPPSSLSSIPPRARLLWRVETRLPDGRRIASPAFSIVIE